MNCFAKATKNRFRFKSDVGMITTEDLWSVPLEVLDKIALDLDKKVNETPTKSFINKDSTGASVEAAKFEVVKEVIDYRLAILERNKKAAATRARNDKIKEIIENKQDAALQDKSLEELQKMLEEGDSDAA